MTTVSLLFDTLVAVLMAAMIFYSIRLNRRISALRDQESALSEMIDQFGQAAARAEASAAHLKSVGTEAERSLRAAVEKAQALRDDLVFMIDRGTGVADGVERSLHAARGAASPAPEAARTQVDESAAAGEGRSQAEQELLKALRAKRVAG